MLRLFSDQAILRQAAVDRAQVLVEPERYQTIVVGEVGVDGGGIMIGDPGYMDGFNRKAWMGTARWREVFDGFQKAADLQDRSGLSQVAEDFPVIGTVYARTPYGDGLYAVSAVVDTLTGKLQSITLHFN